MCHGTANTQLPVASVAIILVRFQTVDCGQRLQYVYINFIESGKKDTSQFSSVKTRVNTSLSEYSNLSYSVRFISLINVLKLK